MDHTTLLQGKRITVMGLGLLGRGVGDAEFLAEQGAELIVTDLKSAEELAPSVERLSKFSNITLVLGEHRTEDFLNRDYILKAAGVPLDSPYIQTAGKAGIPIKMSASWFAELSKLPIIGITGTRGKSTTTYMLNAILEKAGKKVLLGGNVRGVSTLALLKEVTPEHIALFELDSWQLQGFGDARMSPTLSLFTTFYPDHFSYYRNDIDLYLADKANIFLYQKPGDTLILGEQMALTVIEKYGEDIPGRVQVAGQNLLPSEWQLLVPGEHNRYDAALALAAARVLSIPDEISRNALESFLGVPGRLELVALKNGISFYNDTNSTTPEATIVALHALGNEYGKRVILIMGGHDKGLEMKNLLSLIPDVAKRVVLLSGTGTDRVREELPDASVFDTLKEAFDDAVSNAEAGDIVLLSPAFASFGMFTNEYDRGDQFNALVSTL
ncbi:MAG TPA: UDP-N-acetylmuramoyl-L-alanine--D-glutamate ligase [Candidatus Paceibacterota bacterium]|nr:UDP-N-acetylmuramoyl-L-alanine--D-glutamate ligase [Candidatus Paceibacterota bacterium]